MYFLFLEQKTCDPFWFPIARTYEYLSSTRNAVAEHTARCYQSNVARSLLPRFHLSRDKNFFRMNRRTRAHVWERERERERASSRGCWFSLVFLAWSCDQRRSSQVDWAGDIASDGKRRPSEDEKIPSNPECSRLQRFPRAAEFRKPRYHLQFKYVDSPYVCALVNIFVCTSSSFSFARLLSELNSETLAADLCLFVTRLQRREITTQSSLDL